MNNDWFFEKFALIADAPGAVTRMREFILDLASAGKLVPEVLEKPVPDELCRLEEHVTLVMGQAPPGEQYNTNGKGTLFVKVGEFGLLYPRKEIWTTSPLKYAKLGDVLICVVGATVGKLNLAIDCAIGRSVAALRPAISMDTKFLYYSLMPYTIRLRRNSRGSAQGVIGKTELNAIELWVPTIGIQKRIVAKVDELLGLCDALEAQQQERELRKSVLVRSSLSRFAEAPTPENLGYLFHKSYDIPPSELRKSILTLAVHGKLVPFDTEGTKQTVGEHIDFQSGFAFKSQWFTATGARLCRNVNVSHGFLDWKESVSVDEKVAHDFQRFALCEGDIVLSLDRPLIATGLKIARVRQEDLPSLLLQRVARLTPKHEQLSRSYIFLWLNSTAFVDCIDPGRSNGVPHISTRQVQQLAFSVPPLAEQHRIVAKVDQLMSLVDELERQQDESRKKASNLLDAIVQEMTSGG